MLGAQMDKAKSINTPMIASLKLSKQGSDLMCNPTLYRSIVGSLQYVTLIRPEIAFAMNKVCRFMQNHLMIICTLLSTNSNSWSFLFAKAATL